MAVLGAILVAGQPVAAQRYASLAGHVLDTSGGGISGAVVTVTNQETGFRRNAESEIGGAYAVSPLEAGVYKITVRKEGFRTLVRFGMSLAEAQPAAADFVLPVGSILETVIVEGTRSPLERQDAAPETAFEHDEITRLPLNGGGLLQLLETAPGTNVTLSVAATNVNASFQWYLNDNPLPGETGSNLLIQAVNTQHVGAYQVAVTTAARLAGFHQVENTYLSTFRSLGALGLVLGTVGLAAILLRNVLERRRELALLRVVAMTRWQVRKLILSQAVIIGAIRFGLDLQVSLMVVPAVLLVALTATSVGYAIASVLPPMVANMISQMLVVFIFMFSPLNFPADRMPGWLATIHSILPIQAMGEVMRGTIASNAFPLTWGAFLLLGAWCVASFATTSLVLTRRG